MPLLQDSIGLVVPAGAVGSVALATQDVGLAYRVVPSATATSPTTLEVTITYAGATFTHTAPMPSGLAQLVFGYTFATVEGRTGPPANVAVPLSPSLASGSSGSVQFSVDPVLGPVYIARAYAVPSDATARLAEAVAAAAPNATAAALGTSYLYQITLGGVTHVVEQSYNPAVVDLADTQITFAILQDPGTQAYYLGYAIGGNSSVTAAAAGAGGGGVLTASIPFDATAASTPVTVKVSAYDPLTQSATTLVSAALALTPAVFAAVMTAGAGSTGTLGTFEVATNGTVSIPDLSSKGLQVVVQERAQPQVGTLLLPVMLVLPLPISDTLRIPLHTPTRPSHTGHLCVRDCHARRHAPHPGEHRSGQQHHLQRAAGRGDAVCHRVREQCHGG